MKEHEIRPRSLLEQYIATSLADIPAFFDSKRFERVPCPGCGGTETAVAFEKDGFAYEECSACSSLFANPRPPAADLDRYYRESASSRFWATEFYPSTAEARREKIFRPRAEAIRERCAGRGLAPREVVDVGSGYGIFAEELRRAMPDVRVRGIEPGASLAEVSRRRGIEVLERPVEEAAEWHGSADLVTSFEVVEHVYDPVRFVRALAALLRPGGLLLLSGLGIEGFDTQVLWERSKAIQPPHHLNFPSVEGYRRLAERAGLVDVEVTTPGRLDVDIVRNALDEDPDLPLDRFLRVLLLRRGPDVHERFQAFLAAAGLSSHAWVWGRRP